MSGKAMWQTVALEANLSTNDRCLLSVLAFYCRGDEKFCSPSKETIMSKTGLSTHYLAQTMSRLERQGYIKRQVRKDPNTPYKNTSNRYTLLYLKDWENKQDNWEREDQYAEFA
jgi:hypothetical protein